MTERTGLLILAGEFSVFGLLLLASWISNVRVDRDIRALRKLRADAEIEAQS